MTFVLPSTGRGGQFQLITVTGASATVQHPMHPPPYLPGEKVMLVCLRGYALPKSRNAIAEVVDRGGGTFVWEPAEIHCEPASVLDVLPDTGEGGTFVSAARPPYHIHDTATLRCEPGYLLPAQAHTSRVVEVVSTTGQQTLAWEPKEMACLPVQCINPPAIPHGRPDTTDFRYPLWFSYVCDPGYWFASGGNRFQCNTTGQWQPPLPDDPACEPVQCPALMAPEHSVTISTGRDVGSVTNFECSPGYAKASGDNARICQSDGTWTGRDLRCQLASTLARGVALWLVWVLLLMSVLLSGVAWFVGHGGPGRNVRVSVT